MKQYHILIAFSLLATIGLTSCGDRPQNAPNNIATPVSVVELKKGSISKLINTTGTVQPTYGVSLNSADGFEQATTLKTEYNLSRSSFFRILKLIACSLKRGSIFCKPVFWFQATLLLRSCWNTAGLKFSVCRIHNQSPIKRGREKTMPQIEKPDDLHLIASLIRFFACAWQSPPWWKYPKRGWRQIWLRACARWFSERCIWQKRFRLRTNRWKRARCP